MSQTGATLYLFKNYRQTLQSLEGAFHNTKTHKLYNDTLENYSICNVLHIKHILYVLEYL